MILPRGEGIEGGMGAPESNLLSGDLAGQLCFRLGDLETYLLSPSQFAGLAEWLGEMRACCYRNVSPHGPERMDLDGRDHHYWHLLVMDRKQRQLAGSLRMALSRRHRRDWSGEFSYLEHCYPGLDEAMAEAGLAYAEIGRTFVAPPYQRTSRVLLVLLQAMVSIPLATGHSQLLGMVSYNHFKVSEPLQRAFLQALLQPPFAGGLTVPPPRHPLPLAEAVAAGAPSHHATLAELEMDLERQFEQPFRAPILLRRYMQYGNARVLALSLARDFNQITEILMHSDLVLLHESQRSMLVVPHLQPVWERDASFSESVPGGFAADTAAGCGG